MADISMLDTVITGQNITADHHNHQNTAIANVNAEALGAVFEALGPLAGLVGLDLGQIYLPAGMTIGSIQMMCPASAASGVITIDILKVTPGGSVTSLYSAHTKPSLTCNGGYAAATFTGANLPDTTTVAAGDILIVRITAAAADSVDLKVKVS